MNPNTIFKVIKSAMMSVMVAGLVGQTPATPTKGGLLAKHPKTVKKAEAGDPVQQWHVNELLKEQGESPRYAYPKILEALEKQAKGGNPETLYHLAILVGSDTPGIQKNAPRRKAMMADLARMGHAQAMLEHALDLWRDHKDGEQALNWWLKARTTLTTQAEAGDRKAMASLWYQGPPAGLEYHERVLKLPLFVEGTKWIRRSAELGDPEAMTNLGYRLVESSDGVTSGQLEPGRERERERLEREGVEWLKKASERGQWMAMIRLGFVYAEGLGCEMRAFGKTGTPVPKDPAKAWYWWDKAIALVGEEKVMSQLDPSGEGELPPRPVK